MTAVRLMQQGPAHPSLGPGVSSVSISTIQSVVPTVDVFLILCRKEEKKCMFLVKISFFIEICLFVAVLGVGCCVCGENDCSYLQFSRSLVCSGCWTVTWRSRVFVLLGLPQVVITVYDFGRVGGNADHQGLLHI